MNGYVLFFSHSPQLCWLAYLANLLTSKYGIHSVAMVKGKENYKDAITLQAYKEVIDVTEPIINADWVDLTKIESKISDIEKTVGHSFINESVAMDRHYSGSSLNYRDVIRELGRVAAHIERLVAKRGYPLIVIGEPNISSTRLAHMIFNDVPTCYIYQLTKVGKRIYFDYSLGYDWAELGQVYNTYKKEGVPDNIMAQAELLFRKLTEKYEMAYDTNAFLASGGNRHQILAQAAATLGSLLKNPRRYFTKHLNIHHKLIRFIRRYFLYEIRSAYLKKNETVINSGVFDSYSVFFLHFQPEHTVEGVAFEYRNQLETAVTIAASLPCGMHLLVKEHPAMLGYRTITEYKGLRRAKNLVIVSRTVDNASLLKSAKIIFTLSGTVAMEGLLMGVPVITLGRVYYNHLDGIHYLAGGLANLPDLISKVLTFKDDHDHRTRALFALSAIITCSYPGKFSSMFGIKEMGENDNIIELTHAINSELVKLGLIHENDVTTKVI